MCCCLSLGLSSAFQHCKLTPNAGTTNAFLPPSIWSSLLSGTLTAVAWQKKEVLLSSHTKIYIFFLKNSTKIFTFPTELLDFHKVSWFLCKKKKKDPSWKKKRNSCPIPSFCHKAISLKTLSEEKNPNFLILNNYYYYYWSLLHCWRKLEDLGWRF